MSGLPRYDEWKLSESEHLPGLYIDDDCYYMENGDIVCVDCDREYMELRRKVGARGHALRKRIID